MVKVIGGGVAAKGGRRNIFSNIVEHFDIFDIGVGHWWVGLHQEKQSSESESNTMELLSCYKLGSAARILHLSPPPDYVWK